MQGGQTMIKNDTDKREILMDALLTSPDVSAAAKAADTSRSTVYRWLQDADFSAELKQKRDAALDSAIESIKSHSGKAADTLAGMLAADDERVRRMAAKDLLDYSFKILEGRDVLQRLEAIETKLAEKKP
jgi:hypothetical protein